MDIISAMENAKRLKLALLASIGIPQLMLALPVTLLVRLALDLPAIVRHVTLITLFL